MLNNRLTATIYPEGIQTIVTKQGDILNIGSQVDGLTVSYRYEILKNINPRQVGLVFKLPGTFQQLEWDRTGQWNYYPDDHIGRLKGFASGRNDNPLSGPAGPATKPSLAWVMIRINWVQTISGQPK